VATYLFDATGSPIWYSALGSLANAVFTGGLIQYAGGQALGGPYQMPISAGSPGSLQLVFGTPSTANLTWPGNSYTIQRYDFISGGAAQGSTDCNSPQTGWWYAPSQAGRCWRAPVKDMNPSVARANS
jgi:hypothetical protein